MMRRLCAIVILLALLVPGGCVGPGIVATAGLSAAQAGVSEFTKGRLKTAWDVPLEKMFQVTHSSLRKLGYTIEGERSTGNEWFIATRELDGTSLEVYLRRSTPKVTMLSIRAGLFGDQPLSRLIADTIDRQLKDWNESGEESQAEERAAAPQTGS